VSVLSAVRRMAGGPPGSTVNLMSAVRHYCQKWPGKGKGLQWKTTVIAPTMFASPGQAPVRLPESPAVAPGIARLPGNWRPRLRQPAGQVPAHGRAARWKRQPYPHPGSQFASL
jgi:hypothetical protein